MTDRDALARMIEAVETGTPVGIGIWTGALGSAHYTLGTMAAGGSLDAAMALHEALFPGWIWNIVSDSATIWQGPPADPMEGVQEAYVDGNPARAWLLAILRAVEARR